MIKTSKEDMVDNVVTAMWDSNFFTQEQMMQWETIDEEDKLTDNVKDYFTNAYPDIKQYSRATAIK